MKKTMFTAVIAIAAVVGFGANAQADIVWDGAGGGVVTAHTAIAELTTFTTASGFQSPAAGTNGYTTPNTDFYSSKDNTAAASFRIHNGANNDLLGRVQLGAATTGSNVSSMFAWEADAGTLNSITLSGFGGFSGNVSNAGFRFVFQEAGGDWFASATEFDDAGSSQSIANASGASWFAFTPHSGGNATVGSTAVSPTSFEDVSLVGYYQEFDSTGGGGVFSVGFGATFTAVPEPSSFAMFGLLGLSLCRRKR